MTGILYDACAIAAALGIFVAFAGLMFMPRPIGPRLILAAFGLEGAAIALGLSAGTLYGLLGCAMPLAVVIIGRVVWPHLMALLPPESRIPRPSRTEREATR